jgi:hypothetical protein
MWLVDRWLSHQKILLTSIGGSACVCINSLHVGCTFLARAKWDPTAYLDSPMLVGVCA